MKLYSILLPRRPSSLSFSWTTTKDGWMDATAFVPEVWPAAGCANLRCIVVHCSRVFGPDFVGGGPSGLCI